MKSQSVLAVLIGFYVCTLLLPLVSSLWVFGETCGTETEGFGICMPTQEKKVEIYGIIYEQVPGNCSDGSCFKIQKGRSGDLDSSRIATGVECSDEPCGKLGEGFCLQEIPTGFVEVAGGKCPSPGCHCIKEQQGRIGNMDSSRIATGPDCGGERCGKLGEGFCTDRVRPGVEEVADGKCPSLVCSHCVKQKARSSNLESSRIVTGVDCGGERCGKSGEGFCTDTVRPGVEEEVADGKCPSKVCHYCVKQKARSGNLEESRIATENSCGEPCGRSGEGICSGSGDLWNGSVEVDGKCPLKCRCIKQPQY